MPEVAVRTSCLLYAVASSCCSLARAKPCFSQEHKVFCTRCAIRILHTWDWTDQNSYVAAYMAVCHNDLPSRAVWRPSDARATEDMSFVSYVCFSLYIYCLGSLKQNNTLQTVSVPHPLTSASSLWRVPECFHIPPTCQGTEQVWSRTNGGSVPCRLKETLILLQMLVMPLPEGCPYRAWGQPAPWNWEVVSRDRRWAVRKVLPVPRASAIPSDIPCAPASFPQQQQEWSASFLHRFCKRCNHS